MPVPPATPWQPITSTSPVRPRCRVRTLTSQNPVPITRLHGDELSHLVRTCGGQPTTDTSVPLATGVGRPHPLPGVAPRLLGVLPRRLSPSRRHGDWGGGVVWGEGVARLLRLATGTSGVGRVSAPVATVPRQRKETPPTHSWHGNRSGCGEWTATTSSTVGVQGVWLGAGPERERFRRWVTRGEDDLILTS